MPAATILWLTVKDRIYFMERGVCSCSADSSSLYLGYRSCFSGPAEPSVTTCVDKKSKDEDDNDVEDDAFDSPGSSEEELKPGDRTTLLILNSGGNSTGIGKAFGFEVCIRTLLQPTRNLDLNLCHHHSNHNEEAEKQESEPEAEANSRGRRPRRGRRGRDRGQRRRRV